MSDTDADEAADIKLGDRVVAGRITWDINVSTVVILLLAMASGMYFVAQARTQAEQAQKDLARLEGTMTAGFLSLNQQLQPFPTTVARLTELERRADGVDRWRQIHEDRSNQLRDDISRLQSDMAGIRQASNPNELPPGQPQPRQRPH